MASIDIPPPNNRRKMILYKNESIVPVAQRTEKYYRPNYKIKDDAISKDFETLYENGLFDYNDEETSLKMIFDKIAKDNNETNAWTEKLFNLDLVDTRPLRISKRKVSLDSLKADTETSKTNKAVVQSIISMLKHIKTKKDDFTLNYVINNHRYILLEILKFRLTHTKNLNTFKKDMDNMAWLFKSTFDEKNKQYLIYRALISDLQYEFLKKTKKANKFTKKDANKWVSFKNLIKVEEALNVEFEKLLAEKGKDNKAVVMLHYKHLYLSMLILSPTLRGEYRLLKFADNYDKAVKDKANDYVYLPNGEKEIAYYILNKVKKLHDPIQYEIGYIDNNNKNYYGLELTKYLKRSLKLYPREYVFTNLQTKKAYSASAVSNFLANIIEGKNLGINSIRSSVITNIYYGLFNANVKIDLAKKMRNSINAAMYDYSRIVIPEDKRTVAKLKMEPVDDDIVDVEANKIINKAVDKPTVINIITQPNKQYADKKASMTAYNATNRATINKKMADNYEKNKTVISVRTNLRYLNNNSESRPTAKSIEKYQLYEDNGVWHTRIEI
ncbi:hypothetical protein T484DRAFT_1757667 [Baffinella frigidus]|nr:hypothetical protein T484DRAFT_1757667 [Cryptophyta sp. CCMP2293]